MSCLGEGIEKMMDWEDADTRGIFDEANDTVTNRLERGLVICVFRGFSEKRC